MFRALLEVAMSKKCTPLWREAHFEVNMYKTPHVRTTFGSWDVEKVHAVVARSTFPRQKGKNEGYGALLDVQMSFCVEGARDCAPCQKWAKRGGFVAFQKNDCRRGTFEEDLQRWVFRGRRSTRDMFIRDVRRWGRWFPERSCILEHLQFWEDDFAWLVQHFVWPGITFSWQAQYFRQVEWKKCKTQWHEAASSALNFPVLKEASQNCFVLDGVKFQNCEEVAQNCFVLVDR